LYYPNFENMVHFKFCKVKKKYYVKFRQFFRLIQISNNVYVFKDIRESHIA